jgi:hypothetical protein
VGYFIRVVLAAVFGAFEDFGGRVLFGVVDEGEHFVACFDRVAVGVVVVDDVVDGCVLVVAVLVLAVGVGSELD